MKVEELREVLGDDVTLFAPQFDRQDGVEPQRPPLTHDGMDRLQEASQAELEQLGLRKWSDEIGLWLLPYEWHPHIPPQYELLNILGKQTTRAEYPANPDKRFGVLSFGIVPEFEQ